MSKRKKDNATQNRETIIQRVLELMQNVLSAHEERIRVIEARLDELAKKGGE